MRFKEPLQFDLENENADQIMEKIMDAIEQSPRFLKVKSLDEIMQDREPQDFFS